MRDTIGSIVLIGGPLLGMALPLGRSGSDAAPPSDSDGADGEGPDAPRDGRG